MFFGPLFALFFLGCGVIAVVLAVVFQSLVPEFDESARRARILNIFLRIALTEEGARLIIFLFVCAFRGFLAKFLLKSGGFDRSVVSSGGLLAGLAFAAMEGAVHAAADSDILLVRYFSSVPLHGACGVRCALAADGFLNAGAGGKASAARCFIFALIIHSLYDFMLPQGGIFTVLAVMLAITALISSLQSGGAAPEEDAD